MLCAGYVGKGCLAIPQEVGAYPQWWYRKTQQGGSTTDAAVGVERRTPGFDWSAHHLAGSPAGEANFVFL